MLKIYFYSKCGTCRKTLELLKTKGLEPEIIEYQSNPLNKKEILALLKKLKHSASDLLRLNASNKNFIADNDINVEGEENIIQAMVDYPVLIQRPIVETKSAAKICRPSELVLEII